MKDSVTGMVAAILGMIPEGLYLLASVAMVVSVMRLGKQKVLIHDMKCIETLARGSGTVYPCKRPEPCSERT